ncbi:hypothetical protein G7Y89_g12193 [Cudoniella acicularis]|uniref:Ribosomal RNA-processing protein 14/surfeit locus protein 6 C-terminal domain-containing protein n=1 Tax=Cudoniella acicularis TaxID=354080 RepID=A0A8H4RCA8_9HELO|nr:hypothetical protein G7Y89_g12193 [Cudoniella acicularis]
MEDEMNLEACAAACQARQSRIPFMPEEPGTKIDCANTQKPLMAYCPSYQRNITTVRIIVINGKEKKQTKEQAAAARRAKLDPDSAKSAKDIMDERARKRKLEELDESEVEGVEKEQPKQGLKQPHDKKAKKQKTSDGKKDPGFVEVAKSGGGEKRRLMQERKKEKQIKKSEQKKEKVKTAASGTEGLPTNKEAIAEEVHKEKPTEEIRVNKEAISEDDIVEFEAEGLEPIPEEQNSSASPSEAPPSPIFDNATQPSTSTSTSSVIPPATAPRHIKLPTDPELLRARLAARIEALRAARKADGPDGAPARNRQELMEARRKKEEQRRAHKKELRMKAKAEEDARREAALASARDSPASSMMSPSIHSPPHNFSFGRVAFADGQRLADDLTTTRDARKKRGPQDPATALQATENKRLRLAGLDEEKRADIEEKDLWLNAKKRAHGEKVRDDTSLLKKDLET